MSSEFGWIDFSNENQEKMMDVVKLFREKDTRDELGIGTIRDAFSNYFFPGTSTIQTRAKYMLFIPWIYKKLENKKVVFPKIKNRARKYEIKLIYALMKSDDEDGIIGSESKDKLQRLPSEIYWSGLESWGIKLHPGSRNQYHRSLTKNYYKKKKNINKTNKNSNSVESINNWDPGLPDSPTDFLKYAELNLNKTEAEYLEDRIACNHNGSLLFFLINNRIDLDKNIFWNLSFVNNLPKKLRKNIIHARNFSLIIQSASLYYNFMLARVQESQELIDRYNDKLDEWVKTILPYWDDISRWYKNLDNFWNSRPLIENKIPHKTCSFVEQWFKIVFNSNLDDLKDNKEAQELIKDRERKLKGARARLHNPRALEMWGGKSGTALLDYRWDTVKTIIIDIVNGLNEEENKSA